MHFIGSDKYIITKIKCWPFIFYFFVFPCQRPPVGAVGVVPCSGFSIFIFLFFVSLFCSLFLFSIFVFPCQRPPVGAVGVVPCSGFSIYFFIIYFLFFWFSIFIFYFFFLPCQRPAVGAVGAAAGLGGAVRGLEPHLGVAVLGQEGAVREGGKTLLNKEKNGCQSGPVRCKLPKFIHIYIGIAIYLFF